MSARDSKYTQYKNFIDLDLSEDLNSDRESDGDYDLRYMYPSCVSMQKQSE